VRAEHDQVAVEVSGRAEDGGHRVLLAEHVLDVDLRVAGGGPVELVEQLLAVRGRLVGRGDLTVGQVLHAERVDDVQKDEVGVGVAGQVGRVVQGGVGRVGVVGRVEDALEPHDGHLREGDGASTVIIRCDRLAATRRLCGAERSAVTARAAGAQA
jgi:hypothetical protein